MTVERPWSAAADPGRRIGREVEFHAHIGSTNDRARAALGEPGGEGRAVVADLQTAGRGRRGRRWLSPPGVSLMFSVAFRPRAQAERAWWIGAAAVLAIVEAAHPWATLRLRWPNDLVGPDGRKVAGLLLETAVSEGRLTEAVIGAGINVNWRRSQMPAEIADGATSLAEIAGEAVDRVALLERLLSALDREIARAETGTSPAERFGALSALDGRVVQVTVGAGQLEGVARGIDDDGSLLVEASGGVVAVSHGEVVRVRELTGVPA